MSTSNKITDPAISAAINALPPLRELVQQYGLQANKAFGQNYLFDLNLTQKIARLGGDLQGQTVIEIGPGPGGLTRALLTETNATKIIAIEKDRRFIEALQPLVAISKGRLELIEGDALKVNLTSITNAPRSVIANLPYNVGTELLISWLHDVREFKQFILMFQKEVALRMVAKPGTKAYGRLSVLAQSLCHTEIPLHVGPAAFTPPPKVSSSVIRLKPKPDTETIPLKHLEQLTAAAFGQRRKMLRQSLKPYLHAMEVLAIDPQKRAENLTVENYLALARQLACNKAL